MASPRRNRPEKIPTQAKGKSYLVVGGHGLLGSHIVEALLARGETKIRIFDLAPSSLFTDENAAGTVAFVAGDLRRADEVRRACEGIDTVFHTAASVDFWSDLPREYDAIRAVNALGTQNVVEGSVAAGVRQLIFASSAAVVVPHDILDRPIAGADERIPRAQAPFVNHYIATKVEAESIVLAADGRGQLHTAAVRPGGLFGPRELNITANLARGMPGLGLPTNVIDHIYVENVVHAFLLLEQHLKEGAAVCGKAYFITNYDPSSTRDSYRRFNEKLAIALGRRFKIAPRWILSAVAWSVEGLLWGSRGRLRGALGQLAMLRPAALTLARGTYYFSHQKATDDFGYAPLYTIDEAIDATARHQLGG
jgi:sterol-4alpha-carboxylate 3-dehydrogenase (decarboxylating)